VVMEKILVPGMFSCLLWELFSISSRIGLLTVRANAPGSYPDDVLVRPLMP